MAKQKERWWAKVNSHCVRTEDDALVFDNIQKKYKAEFDVHDARSMWFNFDNRDLAFSFAKSIITAMPYLNITIGKAKDG